MFPSTFSLRKIIRKWLSDQATPMLLILHCSPECWESSFNLLGEYTGLSSCGLSPLPHSHFLPFLTQALGSSRGQPPAYFQSSGMPPLLTRDVPAAPNALPPLLPSRLIFSIPSSREIPFTPQGMK